MKSHFQDQLERLKVATLRMAAMTQRAVEKSFYSLFERDANIAEEVIDGDRAINELELELDRQSLRLLALEQPMARDLRHIIGLMRTSNDLERIADQAVNIAERALFLLHRPPLPDFTQLRELADTSLEMLTRITKALVDEDVEEATRVCRMENRADQLNVSVWRAVMDYVTDHSGTAEAAMQTVIAARCMERIADLSTNIAESVIFIVEGVNIKHRCEQ